MWQQCKCANAPISRRLVMGGGLAVAASAVTARAAVAPGAPNAIPPE